MRIVGLKRAAIVSEWGCRVGNHSLTDSGELSSSLSLSLRRAQSSRAEGGRAESGRAESGRAVAAPSEAHPCDRALARAARSLHRPRAGCAEMVRRPPILFLARYVIGVVVRSGGRLNR